MKKFLSVLLTSLLLFGAVLSVPFVGSVSAAGAALIQNGDFESGDVTTVGARSNLKAAFEAQANTPWLALTNPDYGANSKIEQLADGNHALKISRRVLQKLNGLKVGKTYTVSFDAKRTEFAKDAATVALYGCILLILELL